MSLGACSRRSHKSQRLAFIAVGYLQSFRSHAPPNVRPCFRVSHACLADNVMRQCHSITKACLHICISSHIPS